MLLNRTVIAFIAAASALYGAATAQNLILSAAEARAELSACG